ncbi:winged helix-turn-helix transcriptional regulator [Tepidamorphus sp. 3E244]|uniref:winged helix-turn-helix transcriptional regulator n=1 Tax=Tepidamorphus sp. 3E244 TaxID=3385498 RepID=UPI0038FCAC3D
MIDHRSACPVSCALDIIGDKWTLVVLRSIMTGKHRYSDLLAMPEGISTNILADRLQLLEREGLVSRHSYQVRPPRYEYRLTRKGADLLPVVQAMMDWSYRHISGCIDLPTVYRAAKPEELYPEAEE